MKHGKKYVESTKLVESAKVYESAEAFDLVCKTAKAKFCLLYTSPSPRD